MALEETLNDYFASLEMRSSKKYLLVEGPTDKKIFENFLDRLICFDGKNSHDVEIDLVDNIDLSEEPQSLIRPGNRGKVEYVARKVLADPQLHSKGVLFAGFADREFDDFICSLERKQIQDSRMYHRVEGCLVWSRGHSVENYLFEESIFCDLIFEILSISWIPQIISRFRTVFDEAVRVACALGLAAAELQRMNRIRKCLKLESLTLNNEKIAIDFTILESSLISIEEGLDFKLQDLESRYSYHYTKLLSADKSLIKWLCDGHLGLSLLIFSCCKCVEEQHSIYAPSEKPKSEHLVNAISGLRPEATRPKKVSLFGKWWARKVETQDCDYPKELLQILGVLN